MKILTKLVLLFILLCGSLAFGTTVTPIVIDPNVPPEFSVVTYPDRDNRIAVGSDGFIRILVLHQVGSVKSYRLFRCLNETCSSKNMTTLSGSFTSPTIGIGGEEAMSIGPDGFPRISVIGSGSVSTGSLGYIKCNDADCVSSTWVSLGYSASAYTTIATNSSGVSYITYTKSLQGSGKLSYRIATCTGTSCTPDVYTVVPDQTDDGLTFFVGSPIHIASDGTPRLAYTWVAGSNENGTVHYWSNGSDTVVSSDGNFSGLSGMALDTSDNASIAWASYDLAGVNFTHCTNSTCSTNTGITKYLVTQTGSLPATTSVAMGTDGFSRIAISYQGTLHPSPGGTDVVKCTNVSCSTNTTNVLTVSPNTMYLYRQLSEMIMTSVGGVATQSIYAEQTDSNAINLGAVLVQVPETNPDFTLTAAPATVTIPVGGFATYTATVKSVKGFTGTVTFSSSGIPAEATSAFNPTTVNITGTMSFTSAMTVATTKNIVPNTYTMTITGTSGALVHSATVKMIVLAAPPPKFISRKLIDLIGDNPGLTIPVRSKDGKIPFTFSLIQNPVAFVTSTNQWKINSQMVGVSSPALVFYAPVYPIATVPPSAKLPAYTQAITDTNSTIDSAETIGTPPANAGWFYVDSTYVTHFFNVTGTIGATLTTDGSGYTLTGSGSKSVICQVTPCPTVLDTGGNVTANNNNVDPLFKGNLASFTDPNGVVLVASAAGDPAQSVFYKDSLGVTAITASSTNPTSVPPNGPLPTNVYSYLDGKNVTQKFTVSYGQFYQSTNFGCANITEMPRTPVFLPVKVTLPDATFYAITYELTPGGSGDVTGRLATVTLPTGGRFTYAYGGANNGVNCTDGSIPVMTTVTPDSGQWVATHTLN